MYLISIIIIIYLRIQENQNQSSQQKAGSYYTKEKEDTGKHMVD